MQKPLKFQPGSFLEISDMQGARKIVLVCRDGSTYWDVCNAQTVTPLVIFPDLEPVEIGTLSEYVTHHGLQEQLQAQAAWLRLRGDRRVDDPLFFMRMLWCLQTLQEARIDEAAFEVAHAAADAQEQMALNVHQYIDRFREAAGSTSAS
ncbi:MAG: hypothetical protein LBE22_03730 [Azoarcus sp.]|jgi:hypothetical protein|nr:hypothetical protein [Azoarcus sp.]